MKQETITAELTHKDAKITEDFAWQIYNFINNWKAGNYGTISLQEALDKDFDH